MKTLAPILAALMLAACVPTVQPVTTLPQPATPRPATPLPAAPQPATPSGSPIVINNDAGGNVMAMMNRRNELEASGRPVEIRGYCRSACTMLITLPNACLAPNATIGFHAPRLPGTTIIPPLVDEIMASTYRGGIRDRWNRDWKHSIEMQKISAREYVALDPQTRLCAR